MIGENTEKDFKLENYEDFYEHHNFQPMGENDAFNVHEVIPRFGWAFDRIWDLHQERVGGDTSNLRVLDLGCLDGSFILTLARHQPWVSGYGIDLTKDGIEIANDRAKAMYEPRPVFEQGTIEGFLKLYANLGLKFDVITAFEIMEHVKDPKAVLEAIDKVLALNGIVLISTPDFEDPLFGKDDEQNKCHIRLFTTALEDYEGVNKFGTTRKATSLPALVKSMKNWYIENIEVVSHLINCEMGRDEQ